MEQHPVPQHIASFEFKLFGNLTVRQFVTLSIPLAFAALIFFSNLTVYLRFPLAIIFAGVGLFAALVPIQGRPLDKWVVLFIKAIMAPTQRIWVKDAKLPEFLDIVVSQPKSTGNNQAEPITAGDRERLRSYLRSVPKGEVSPFDVKEQIAIERLNLSTEGAGQGKLPPAVIWSNGGVLANQRNMSLPQIQRVTPMRMADAAVQITSGMPAREEDYQGKMAEALPAISENPKPRVKISNHAKPYVLPGIEKRISKPMAFIKPKVQLASETNFSIENVIPITTPGKTMRLLHGVGKTRARKLHFGPPAGFDLNNLPIRGEVRFEVSDQLKKRLDPKLFMEEPVEKETSGLDIASGDGTRGSVKEGQFANVKKFQTAVSHAHIRASVDSLSPDKATETATGDSRVRVLRDEVGGQTKPAGLLSRASIVPLTNIPNVLSGLVADASGVPLEGAIVTVRDEHGVPVRALKTNKLGQFLSATPLSSGVYTLDVDGSELDFEPLRLNFAGEVLAPLSIKAK